MPLLEVDGAAAQAAAFIGSSAMALSAPTAGCGWHGWTSRSR
ncbi:hypothetical protein BZL30_9268 [Mycobacterium kansasii]|uniref:Uncharacterized protein n=1 Tax=Mycobacterium kansasii TaxID=1768 RepID=A0A1V3WCK2_MYCKA|nr:hypothetical protein BZL30_9268 [Mycobacterium kansasii]